MKMGHDKTLELLVLAPPLLKLLCMELVNRGELSLLRLQLCLQLLLRKAR